MTLGISQTGTARQRPINGRGEAMQRRSLSIIAGISMLVVVAPQPGLRGQDDPAPGHGIEWFDGDFDAAQAQALKDGRPLMAYFTFET